MTDWVKDLGFAQADYPPREHGQRCRRGDILRCEEFDEEDKTTAVIYYCWMCRRFWKFEPKELKSTRKGREAQMDRADAIYRKRLSRDVGHLATGPRLPAGAAAK